MKILYATLASAGIAVALAWLYHIATGRSLSWGYWLSMLFVTAWVVVPTSVRARRNADAARDIHRTFDAP